MKPRTRDNIIKDVCEISLRSKKKEWEDWEDHHINPKWEK